MIRVRVEPKQEASLRYLSDVRGETASDVIRDALDEHVAKSEETGMQEQLQEQEDTRALLQAVRSLNARLDRLEQKS